MTLTVERVVTSGVFSLDGQDFDVKNNVWIVGDDDEVLVVDAAHDAASIVASVRGRRVSAIVCTHGHNDHVNAAVALADHISAPVLLHPADRMLWDAVHPIRPPDRDLIDGELLSVGGGELAVLHTPGHTPGGVCLHHAAGQLLFSGDTLFAGGPGATGRSYSDFATLLHSIQARLFPLPAETIVHTGHGENTTIGAEQPCYDEWVAGGH